MDPSTRATANRSIRTIKTEIDYLLDTSLLSPSAATSILSLLPDLSNPAPNPPAAQIPNLSTLSLSEKQPPSQHAGWYSPSPTPGRQDYQPPAYSAPPGPPPTQSAPAPAALTYATAIYAYAPTDAGDLALAPNERVAVTEYMNAEWWKGRSERTGAEGIFPRSYVREEQQGQPQGGFQQQQTLQKQTQNQMGYPGNMPVAAAQGQQQQQQGYGQQGGGGSGTPGKGGEMAKKAGKKLGNAALFGAGATIGSNIVNSIF